MRYQHIAGHSNGYLHHITSKGKGLCITYHTYQAGGIIAIEEERVEAAEKRTKGPSSLEISYGGQRQID